MMKSIAEQSKVFNRLAAPIVIPDDIKHDPVKIKAFKKRLTMATIDRK